MLFSYAKELNSDIQYMSLENMPNDKHYAKLDNQRTNIL